LEKEKRVWDTIFTQPEVYYKGLDPLKPNADSPQFLKEEETKLLKKTMETDEQEVDKSCQLLELKVVEYISF
jgi:hypothetical protein